MCYRSSHPPGPGPRQHARPRPVLLSRLARLRARRPALPVRPVAARRARDRVARPPLEKQPAADGRLVLAVLVLGRAVAGAGAEGGAAAAHVRAAGPLAPLGEAAQATAAAIYRRVESARSH